MNNHGLKSNFLNILFRETKLKLVSFLNSNSKERVGIFHNDKVYDLKKSGEAFGIKLPSKMKKLLNRWEEYLPSTSKSFKRN